MTQPQRNITGLTRQRDRLLEPPPARLPTATPLSPPARRTLRTGKRFIAVMHRDIGWLKAESDRCETRGYDAGKERSLITSAEAVIASVCEMMRAVVNEDRRIAALELALFHPDQPRVPAGNPGGGEWTSGDWGGGTPHVESVSDKIRTPINLQEEHEKGGHGYPKHVGKSEAELIKTLDDHYYRFLGFTVSKAAEGSFSDILQANDFVNRTLEANQGIVDLVSGGEITGNAWIARRFGYKTGYEAYRPDADSNAYIRPGLFNAL
jgi:hypothetical protein